MRLHIEHTTIYRYARPVGFGRHRLVLRPREGHDQRVERMSLRIEPAHSLLWVRDVFGTSIALVDPLVPADVLSIVNDVVVERLEPFPSRAFHEPWRVPLPPRYDPLESPVTAVYQSPAFPGDAAHVGAWLESGFDPAAGDAEGTMQALCDRVYRTVAYRRRDERACRDPP